MSKNRYYYSVGKLKAKAKPVIMYRPRRRGAGGDVQLQAFSVTVTNGALTADPLLK
jgi:hypothetical protein